MAERCLPRHRIERALDLFPCPSPGLLPGGGWFFAPFVPSFVCLVSAFLGLLPWPLWPSVFFHRPLSVAMLKAMEQLTIDAADDTDGVLAGSLVFAVLARLRIGDLRRCTEEPRIDTGPVDEAGFIESTFFDHKTAAVGSKNSLPVVAPLLGVTGLPWARAWLERRRRCSLDAAVDGTLLPAPAAGGGWTSVPMTTKEFGDVMKSLLTVAGFPPESLAKVGSHSCKCTVLTWAAKAAVPREDRLALGYHVRQGGRSMEAYSRDSMAGPLRELTAVIAKIRGGKFLPDLTRSGYWPTPASPTCSTRSSSSSSSAALESDCAVPSDGEVSLDYVYNNLSDYVHRVKGFKLHCGKAFPKDHTLLSEPPEGAQRCSGCF